MTIEFMIVPSVHATQGRIQGGGFVGFERTPFSSNHSTYCSFVTPTSVCHSANLLRAIHLNLHAAKQFSKGGPKCSSCWHWQRWAWSFPIFFARSSSTFVNEPPFISCWIHRCHMVLHSRSVCRYRNTCSCSGKHSLSASLEADVCIIFLCLLEALQCGCTHVCTCTACAVRLHYDWQVKVWI